MTDGITLAVMNALSTRADARRSRQALLEAGAAALAECGVDVQVSEIVRRAGLAKQTFFRHFPSKDALVVAILVENIDRHTDTAREVLADGGDDLLGQFMTRCGAQIAPIRAIIEHVALRGVGETSIGDAIARLLSAIADILTEAASRGEVRDDLSAIDIHILLMSVTSVSAHSYYRDAPDLWRRYLAVVLAGLRPGCAGGLPVATPSQRWVSAPVSGR